MQALPAVVDSGGSAETSGEAIMNGSATPDYMGVNHSNIVDTFLESVVRRLGDSGHCLCLFAVGSTE